MLEQSLSVGELVEYGLLSGDLSPGFLSSTRMVEGSRAHRAVQSILTPPWQSEYWLQTSLSQQGCTLHVSGRADAVCITDGMGEVLELKSLRHQPVDFQPRAQHIRQAEVYAHMLALKENLPRVRYTVRYISPEGETLSEHPCEKDADALREGFEQLAGGYLTYMAQKAQHMQRRNSTLSRLPFPYDAKREGQEDFLLAVTDAIAEDGRAYIQAPTGTGKTAAALFPAVASLIEGRAHRVFYLTAKNSGKRSAEDLLLRLEKQGAFVRRLTLTAKQSICPHPGTPCHPMYCPFAEGYFNRVRPAVEELCAIGAASRKVIVQVAKRHQVCPFELSLDYSTECDVIIADYNYVFDPRVRLQRFFGIGTSADSAILVDEAHNLVERAREMFSAQLLRRPLRRLYRQLMPLPNISAGAVCDAIKRVGQALDELAKPIGRQPFRILDEPPSQIVRPLRAFTRAADALLSEGVEEDVKELLFDQFFQAQAFLSAAERYESPADCVYLEQTEQGLLLRIYCQSPAKRIRAALERTQAAIFFSATLTPLDYYQRMLGGERGDVLLDLPSPFPQENLLLLIDPTVKTTYSARGETYSRVAQSILTVAQAHPGKYLAFFPSYRYMEAVRGMLYGYEGDIKLIAQRPGMDEKARIAFLKAFETPAPDQTLLGMAVMGGSFSEGIDLPGEMLIGAIVVGVGLPMVCLPREIIRARAEENGENGFAQAYVYPGLTRVLQAAGRVIRSADDRGVVLLIDERYAQEDYRELLPPHWQQVLVQSPEETQEYAQTFWGDEG